jgi:hypothetical protein
LSIPKEATCTVFKGADFDVLDFHEDGKIYLSIYVGYAPSFPGKEDGEQTVEVIHGLKVKEVAAVSSQGTHREYLFYNPIRKGPFLHAFYDKLSGVELKNAEMSARSIKFR